VRILKRRGGGILAPVALDLHGAVASQPAALHRPAPSGSRCFRPA
jgi:hypothetical protein